MTGPVRPAGDNRLEECDISMADNLPEKKKKSPAREVLESIAIAVVLAVLIRMFIIQPFYIPSGSMEPNLQINDRIIVSKFTYHFWQPRRGDIVVFKYPLDPSRDFVKRLIAFGGETVAIRDGRLYINGRLQPEPYLPVGLRTADFGPVKVPPGHYWMMGDNRNNSDDSRIWGPLPKENVVGKAVFIYWPLGHIKVLQ